MKRKQVDRYSMMIIGKYFKTKQDYINIIMVNSKYNKLNEMYLFNPISITSLSLFPNIQTYYLYSKYDKNEILMRKIQLKYVNYPISYKEYLDYKRFYSNITFRCIYYSQNDSYSHGKQIKDVINILSSNSLEYYQNATISCSSSLHSIERECFRKSFHLQSFSLPSTITSLGISCFSTNVNLTSITLSCSLLSLPSFCFSHCSKLQSIRFENNALFMESIGESCFEHCSSLTSLTIPSTVTSLGNNCFAFCKSLQSLTISYNSPLLSLCSLSDQSSLTFQQYFYNCNNIKIYKSFY